MCLSPSLKRKVFYCFFVLFFPFLFNIAEPGSHSWENAHICGMSQRMSPLKAIDPHPQNVHLDTYTF